MKERPHLKSIILIAAICLIAYANTFGNEFVWDDKNLIAESVRLKDLGNVPSAFTMGIWDFSGIEGGDADYYRPILLLSLMADYQIWGLNPFGYHLMNLLLHILSTILLYLVVYLILEKREISLIAALLFAVHPVHTEAVTFISGRDYGLFLFFFLLSLYFYIKNRDKLGWVYTASVASFFIAMFSKEIAITLPIIVVLYDFCFVEKMDLKNMVSRIKFYLPFFTIAFLYLFIRFFILGIGPARVEYLGGSFYLTLITMSTIFIRYVLLLFAPLELTIEHAIPIATSILEPAVLLSTLFLFALLVFTLKMYKSHRLVFFSIAWFFITLLPVSNILPQTYLMAERYLYLPSIGFCILAAVIIQEILDRFPGEKSFDFSLAHKVTLSVPQKNIKRIIILCLILILALYSIRTIARNNDWKDDMTLWSETVKSSPHSYKAHDTLGSLYANRGLYDEAIAEYKEALKIDPNLALAHNNLGATYAKKGMYDEAIDEFKEALRINPNHVTAHNNLGTVYGKKGWYDKAIAEYKEALRINPDYVEAHYNFGNAHFYRGLYDEAIAEYKEALRIDPDYADAHYNLGSAYGGKGLYDKAIAEFKEVLRINPNYANMHYTLGIAYGEKGWHDEAIAEFKEVLRINPNFAPAHYNLGTAYDRKGWNDEAITEFEKAIELSPGYINAHNNLGVVYGRKELYDEAIAEFEKAIGLNPNHTNAHNNLGFTYSKKGLYDEAIIEFKKAIELDPNYADAHNDLGDAYINKGLYDEAIAEFKEALGIDPDAAGAHNNLGTAYWHTKQYDLAKQEWEKVLEIDPNFEQAKEKLNELEEMGY